MSSQRLTTSLIISEGKNSEPSDSIFLLTLMAFGIMTISSFSKSILSMNFLYAFDFLVISAIQNHLQLNMYLRIKILISTNLGLLIVHQVYFLIFLIFL